MLRLKPTKPIHLAKPWPTSEQTGWKNLTIEYASRRAPAAWGIKALRREAAQVAATTGRLVESVTHDRLRDRTSFQTEEVGPQSPHTSDAAVQAFNQMIDEALETSAAA